MKYLLGFVLIIACTSPELQKMEKEKMTRTQNIETVKKFLRLLEQEKIEEFSELYAENGKQINPYHSGLFPPEIDGKKNIYDFWINVPGNFDGMQPKAVRAFAETALKGKIKLKNNAGMYENDYLCLFYFNDQGKILEYHEYFNPLTAAKGFGLLEQIK